MSKFGDHFSSIKADNGEVRTILQDGAPEWMTEACRDAMRCCMSEWLWDECEAAFVAIDEGSLTDQDDAHTYADSRVDVYTKARYEWAATHCLMDVFTDAEGEVEDCGGFEADKSISDRIALVQFFAIQHIALTILAAVQKHGSEEEETEEGEEVAEDA